MSWRTETLGNLLFESKIPATNPNPNKRIRVKLNIAGVEKRPIENEIEGATKQFIRKSGQFIYGKQNFHKGAFGIIPTELDGFETSADIPSFDLREDCLPEWIFYFFKINNRYIELEKIARGMGSKRIHSEQLYDIEIPLPSIEDQKLYISKFKKIEISVSSTNYEHAHQLDLLKILRQQILQDAMQGNLVTQDPNDQSACKLLEIIKVEKENKDKPSNEIRPEEIPFEIPENWVWCRLGEVADISGGVTLGKQYSMITEEYKYLRVANVQRGFLLLQDIKKINIPSADAKKILLKKNDLLVIEGNGSIKEIGRCAMWKNEIDNCIHQNHIIRIRLKNDTISHFYYKYLNSPVCVEKMQKLAITTTGLFTLSVGKINNLIIPLPPLSEQDRIVAKIEQLMKLCDELEQTFQQNQKYTQELLQVALKEALEQEPTEIFKI